MKLLLDENLSRRLVPALQARFPGSSQVALLELERSTDAALCTYAAHLVLGNTHNDAVLAACWPRPTVCTPRSATRQRAWWYSNE